MPAKAAKKPANAKAASADGKKPRPHEEEEPAQAEGSSTHANSGGQPAGLAAEDDHSNEDPASPKSGKEQEHDDRHEAASADPVTAAQLAASPASAPPDQVKLTEVSTSKGSLLPADPRVKTDSQSVPGAIQAQLGASEDDEPAASVESIDIQSSGKQAGPATPSHRAAKAVTGEAENHVPADKGVAPDTAQVFQNQAVASLSDLVSDAAPPPSSPASTAHGAAGIAPVSGLDGSLTAGGPPAPGAHAAASEFRLPSAAASAPSPQVQFTQANHGPIVSGIRGELLPGGGTMQIRLDPPELGALRVSVEMKNGVMTATFEASSDQAAKLLSHSLGDLKSALETQGVNVESLHVKQAASSQASRGSGGQPDGQPGAGHEQDQNAQREQQRRQMLQKLWSRLRGGDPLDMVA